ncbi:MAG: DUF2786 domain-containing protein [Fusobacterium sp.]
MNKIEKLKKLRSLSEDTSTTEAERNLAYKRYLEFKSKYSLEDEEDEIELLDIKVNNEFESILLSYVLSSFGIDKTYHKKNYSQLRKYFYTDKNTYKAIIDDFEYHRYNVNEIIKGVLHRYCHTQVEIPKPQNVSDEEVSELLEKSYYENSWLDEEEYKNCLRIAKK